jgi:hypothetical protein
MTDHFNPNWLKRKTVQKVDMNPFERGLYHPRGKTYDPIIWFTDGSRISFVVDETEVGEYGIRISYAKGRP